MEGLISIQPDKKPVVKKRRPIKPLEYYENIRGCEYRYRRNGDQVYVYTDGVAELADNEHCQWIITLIRSYYGVQRVRMEPFQVFKFKKFGGNRLCVRIEDGNGNVVAVQNEDYTDLPFDEITIWCIKEGVRRVILLPFEY